MILVITEQQDGNFRQASLTAVTAGARLAKSLQVPCIALVPGTATSPESLGEYGADRVMHIYNRALDTFDSQVYTTVIGDIATQEKARVVIVSHTSTGRQLLGRLAARLSAAAASGVSRISAENGEVVVTRSAFSGKAIETLKSQSGTIVVSLLQNAIQPERSGSRAGVEKPAIDVPVASVKVREVRRQDGKIPLPEASLVVSAGRGMKEASNWGIVEELADVLGAATACSRPVADSGWRPHHEHVGQTGLAIRPKLYIAIGISGAIQHLAGVNNSKVIVVINKDPEAPFFKAADYGVCGDLFEVVPRLTEALKKAMP